MLRGEQARLDHLKAKYQPVFDLLTEHAAVITEQRMIAARLYIHAAVTSSPAVLKLAQAAAAAAAAVDPNTTSDLLLNIESFPTFPTPSKTPASPASSPEERPPDPIYTPSPPLAPDAPPPGHKSLAVLTYVVQPNDTLESISTLFYGTPTYVEKIYNANADILIHPRTPLYPGQQLTIPNP